jgi:hypothetical protein
VPGSSPKLRQARNPPRRPTVRALRAELAW